MVTIFDTSSVYTDIDIDGLCMYTIKNIWLEKEKYQGKQKKPALMLKLTCDLKNLYQCQFGIFLYHQC